MAKTGKTGLGHKQSSQSLHNLRTSKFNSFGKPVKVSRDGGDKQSALYRLGVALKQVNEHD